MGAIDWNSYIKAAADAGESLDEFTPLPEGEYDVKALETKATKTSSTNKDMIVITWVVEGGPYAGRRLWSNLVVSPESAQSMGILIRQLTALGVRPLLEAGASFEQIAAGLKNALATVTVKVGEYKGKPKNDVKGIKGRSGGGSAPSGPGATPTFSGPQGLPI